MSFNVQRATRLLERALTTPDPTVALGALTALREELDALEQQQVARALHDGRAFSDIARPLGITRQAAHRRYRGLNVAGSLPPEPRAVLLRAREEAAAHHSYCIDSRHLLLALATSGAVQLRVAAARRSLEPPSVEAQTPSGLEPQLHARLLPWSKQLRVEHLIRAALDDPAAQALLDRFGGDRAPEPLARL